MSGERGGEGEGYGAANRLLDTALGELTGGRRPPDVTAAALRAVAAGELWPRLRWAQAVLMLLGVGVAAGVWWLRGHRSDAVAQQPAEQLTPQEPVVLPPPQRACKGVDELRRLPADTEDLIADLGDVRDLNELQRFPNLRHLGINAVVGVLGSTWEHPPQDALAPLGELPRLEWVDLPFVLPVSRQLLAPLAKVPRLDTLGIVGAGNPLTAELATALATLPRLHHLHFLSTPVSAAGVRGLASVSGLSSIEFFYCPGLDADAQAELARLTNLRAIKIAGAGGFAIQLGAVPTPLPLLAPSTLRALADRPRPEVALRSCRVDDALLAALPGKLITLSLTHCDGITAPALRGLKRCGALLSVSLGGSLTDSPPDGEVWAAEADLIGTLHLARLEYQGQLTPVVQDAIAAQLGLRELELGVQRDGATDISFAARLPSLVRVVLWNEWTIDQIKPLAQCRNLRRVELRNWGDTPVRRLLLQVVRQTLGPRIEVLAW